MKKVSVILMILTIIFGTTELLIAQNGRGVGKNRQKGFCQADKNKDGKISKEEAKQAPRKYLAENFDEIDTNVDGYIEKSELRNMREKRRKKMQKLADSNKDGKISIEEMTAFKKQRLIEADKNKNGFLEPEELEQMRRLRRNGCIYK